MIGYSAELGNRRAGNRRGSRLARTVVAFGIGAVVMVSLLIVPKPPEARAFPGNATPNDAIANLAMQYVGRWGGEACRDAGRSGYNGSTPGGQLHDGLCKAWMVCVVLMATGRWVGNDSPSYQTGFPREGAIEVRPDEARRGDLVMIGSTDSSFPLHAAIIWAPISGQRFQVIDSNFAPDEKVRFGTLLIPTYESHIYRIGQVSSGRNPDINGTRGSILGSIGDGSVMPAAGSPINPIPYPAAAGGGSGPIVLTPSTAATTAPTTQATTTTPTTIVTLTQPTTATTQATIPVTQATTATTQGTTATTQGTTATTQGTTATTQGTTATTQGTTATTQGTQATTTTKAAATGSGTTTTTRVSSTTGNTGTTTTTRVGTPASGSSTTTTTNVGSTGGGSTGGGSSGGSTGGGSSGGSSGTASQNLSASAAPASGLSTDVGSTTGGGSGGSSATGATARTGTNTNVKGESITSANGASGVSASGPGSPNLLPVRINLNKIAYDAYANKKCKSGVILYRKVMVKKKLVLQKTCATVAQAKAVRKAQAQLPNG